MQRIGSISLALAVLSLIGTILLRFQAQRMGAAALGLVPVILISAYGLPLIGLCLALFVLGKGDRKATVVAAAAVNALLLVVGGGLVWSWLS